MAKFTRAELDEQTRVGREKRRAERAAHKLQGMRKLLAALFAAMAPLLAIGPKWLNWWEKEQTDREAARDAQRDYRNSMATARHYQRLAFRAAYGS